MAAHEYINQEQLRGLIAGDFYMAGTPDEEQIKVGDLHPDGISMYSWDKDHYEGLKEDIKSKGIHTPLAVSKNMLMDGHHRAVAAMELGLPQIPVSDW
jgi:ParB-like chromosome segregation protein Spo0J